MNNIVILGGGYGGLQIANGIINSNIPDKYTITLIDRNPFHSIKTEFHALVAGTVPENEIRLPFPNTPRINVVCDEVISVVPNENKVILKSKEVKYDYLIMGLGVESNYHGIKGAEDYSFGLQTMKEARNTYAALHNIRPFGHVSIVGGGLTGIEVASELRESRPDLNLRLIDRGDKVLSPFPERLQDYVEKWFKQHDIEILHNSRVDYVEPGTLCNEGVCLNTDITIWSAGTQVSKVVRSTDLSKDSKGRILVNKHHQAIGKSNIFVVGDCASSPYPPSAQIAKAQGKQIVGVLECVLSGTEPQDPSDIKVKGTLGSLGKKDGFGTAMNTSLTGAVPRLLKSGILWIHRWNN